MMPVRIPQQKVQKRIMQRGQQGKEMEAEMLSFLHTYIEEHKNVEGDKGRKKEFFYLL